MKTLFILLVCFLAISCSNNKKSGRSVQIKSEPEFNDFRQWTLSPPMGWNSFDAYDSRVTEEQFKKQVNFISEKLLQYGWNYAVIDYIWWNPEPGNWKNPGKRLGHPNIRYAYDGKPLDTTTIDEYGRLLPALSRFPSSAGGKGFRPIADYVHGKGMKFGIHLMRGAHKYAYYYNLPVKGTDHTFRDISNTSDTCDWCNHMYGVDPTKPGAQEYYNSLFELYASWEVDFVKVDDILSPEYHKGEIEMIRKAIDRSGRPMVLSLSPGNNTPVNMGEHLAANANMWRISGDFWDDWKKLRQNFDLIETWQPFIKTGTWPDADMLPIGRLSIGGRPHGPERNSGFTWPEHYTLLTLWSISKSPLMIGADLTSSPDSTLFFLTNPEIIQVDQKSTGNRQLFKNERDAAWLAEDPDSGGKYLALFNLTDSVRTISVDLNSILPVRKVIIRDLWQRADLGAFKGIYSTKIQPHGAAMLRISGK
jgi:alpha-galactosidase